MQKLDVSDDDAEAAPATAAAVADVGEKANAKLEKAQRKRDKKRQEERERLERIEFESQNVVSQRQIESDAIAAQLTSLGLIVKEIPSDGHCMYHAVADQLKLTRRLPFPSSDAYIPLRQKTAAYLRSHADDFVPFVELDYASDIAIQDQFESYCARVEATADWGGQVELRALAQALAVPIEVYSASSSVLVMGDEYHREDQPPLRLSYHLHYYTLGEHFNSIVYASSGGDEHDAL
ncbi:hypothetical protein, variant 2 [Aphanomyces astaci]|nr:hypothetical protein, variant 2 [Aphanomyces astaci]ETV64741.1 hypothetical protein, variant 2 [Aphanomyces astaci]|eukprot:XP_009845780.1 hypothetical protein, variant 2 [Aphanomyces astaci]